MIGQIIETQINGIPCKVEVTHFFICEPWKGSAHTCPSRDDYYGYEEIEFNILDRKGYKAEWLEKKMKPGDVERINEEIMDYYRNYE